MKFLKQFVSALRVASLVVLALGAAQAQAQISQSISFTQPTTPMVYSPGLTFNLTATGGGSGNPIVFGSQTTARCTVSGNVVTVVSANGYCNVTADQAGNGTYSAAPTEIRYVYINQADQTITFTQPTTPITYSPGLTFSLSATGGASGNPIVYGTQTPSICTVSGNTATVVAGGNCAVSAAQAGNDNYHAATTIVNYVTVNQVDQTITFTQPPTPITYAPSQTFTLSATGGASGNAIVYSSSTTAVCTVSGNVTTVVKAGNCTVVASQAGNGAYNAAIPVGHDVTINKADQTVTFNALSDQTLGTGTITVSATASSGLATTFASQTTSKCTVSGSTVTLVATGTCTIRAKQTGNNGYNAAPNVDRSFTISTGTAQAITGFAPTTPIVYQPSPSNTFALSATGGASGNPVVFASTTTSVCTVSSSTVTVLTGGTCTLTANQAGNATYSPAPQVTANVVIAAASQTITFATLADKQVSDPAFTVSATATSGLTVTFSSTTTGVCTVATNTVTLVSAGTCSIKADQAGNASYAAATSVTRSFTVNAGTQIYYIHADHLGTPRVITKSSDNTKVWEWKNVEPFGNDVPNEDPGSTGTNFKYNLRFPGQYADSETNTNYNYFRDYDPTSGRYLRSDPIGLIGGLNTYAYVNGQPLLRIDPFGLASKDTICWKGTDCIKPPFEPDPEKPRPSPQPGKPDKDPRKPIDKNKQYSCAEVEETLGGCLACCASRSPGQYAKKQGSICSEECYKKAGITLLAPSPLPCEIASAF